MKYRSFVEQLFTHTPEAQPLPGQIANSAGGFYFAIDDWAQLDRFLVLGTDVGTYYASPIALTKENTEVVQKLLKSDGLRVVKRIVEISIQNRAPKNSAALFALALAASCEELTVRQAALSNLSRVARTGSHLLEFASYANQLRGWGRALRKAIGNWFLDMPIEQLALQAVKYQQREGWALRDLLRLSHPKWEEEDERRALLNWIVRPDVAEAIAAARKLRLIEGKYLAKEATSKKEIAKIVSKYSLPREALPTEALNTLEVWDALLVDMPMTALIRNLGKMTQIGLLAPLSASSDYVAGRLQDREELIRAKISPFQLLLALRTYANGHGALGSLRWTPVPRIVDALDRAFEESFARVTPTHKRILVGVDVSGSMQISCAGSPVLSAIEAAIAVAFFFVRTEKNVHVIEFDTGAHEFPISPRQRLDNLLSNIKWGGGTDLGVTVSYALDHKMPLDAILILTDNECWAGKAHCASLLQEYRKTINPDVKLVVMATAANSGAVCDPKDGRSLGIAGFDAAAPQMVLDFIRGGE